MKNTPEKTGGRYRIESSHPLHNPFWNALGFRNEFSDRSLAVALAAKSGALPCGAEVRVVHTHSGEVIFRKHNDCNCGAGLLA